MVGAEHFDLEGAGVFGGPFEERFPFRSGEFLPLRCALYARYSSDQQRAASIEDQFRVCRERATGEGWKIAGTYKDSAISGDSMILRPGIQALLKEARRGTFEILVAEALDRVSRDQADVATLYKHLRFAGVMIVTLAEGEISELHVTSPNDWVRIDIPEWQIVPRDLWDKAQEMRFRNHQRASHKSRRPKHLFSGLLQCGLCEGAYTMRSTDRLGCVAPREKATCENSRTIKLVDLEFRVLSGLKRNLLRPEYFEEFCVELNAELVRLAEVACSEEASLVSKVAKIDRKIEHVVDAIADGASSDSLRNKLTSLRDEKTEIERYIAARKTASGITELPANLSEIYRNEVENLVS